MRHIIDLDPEVWEKIQELLREHRYSSVAQFITVAIQNQIELELAPQESTDAGSRNQLDDVPRTADISGPLSLKAPTEEPALAQSIQKADPDEIIWGLYNRIFPVKITLRALSQLLLSNDSKSIDLKVLREESALRARTIGKHLLVADKNRKLSRGERFATGLPVRRGDKALERFKNMFVGTMSNKGRIGGFPVALRFVLLERKNGHPEASLTRDGFNFAKLRNPVLDGEWEKAEGTLSEEEAQFYMSCVKKTLPREWELSRLIIEGITDGKDTPDAVDKTLKKFLPSLQDSMLAPTRAGVIGRLDELGLVHRVQDGTRVSYVLTNGGESFLKSTEARPRLHDST